MKQRREPVWVGKKDAKESTRMTEQFEHFKSAMHLVRSHKKKPNHFYHDGKYRINFAWLQHAFTGCRVRKRNRKATEQENTQTVKLWREIKISSILLKADPT
jgi:hypothetical protein